MTDTHVDLFATNPMSSRGPTLIRRTQLKDPDLTPSMIAGSNIYIGVSEEHTLADCPFVDSDVRSAQMEKLVAELGDLQEKHHRSQRINLRLMKATAVVMLITLAVLTVRLVF